MPYGPDFGAAMSVLRDRYQQHEQFSTAERREALRTLVRLAGEVGCPEDRLRRIVDLACGGSRVPPHLRSEARENLIREVLATAARRSPGAEGRS